MEFELSGNASNWTDDTSDSLIDPRRCMKVHKASACAR